MPIIPMTRSEWQALEENGGRFAGETDLDVVLDPTDRLPVMFATVPGIPTISKKRAAEHGIYVEMSSKNPLHRFYRRQHHIRQEAIIDSHVAHDQAVRESYEAHERQSKTFLLWVDIICNTLNLQRDFLANVFHRHNKETKYT